MLSKCGMSCKECVELTLKFVFVAVFTYGVMSAVCCMKSCNTSCSSQFSCSKANTQPVAKLCGPDCQKPCCATK
jgi:hypothetical protein